jgi:amidohydrolase
MLRRASIFPVFLVMMVLPEPAQAQGHPLPAAIDRLSDALASKVIEWRRDFHEHPELSNREFRTAQKVAAHLESLGIEVTTEVAHTGVVGVLQGAQPGPVVALRADMDGLPVTERVPLSFASKVTSIYNGQEVGVMHACGHDTHVAMLMGVAEMLASMRDDLRGTVKFIFQPAEEGAPAGEEGGAALMVAEGVLKNPDVEVIFGLHIWAKQDIGIIGYRPGGLLAAVDDFGITVKGVQTHGSQPWAGVDPVVVSAQIINGLQTIVSRQLELTKNAAVVTVGSIHGGVRSNIIPEQVELIGTIRSLDGEMREQIHERIHRTATHIAQSMGATAEVKIPLTTSYPITYNDPALVEEMLPALHAVAGRENVQLIDAITGAEDFSFFAEQVPGFFFFLGGKPLDKTEEEAAPHHTPDFYIDESGLELGVRTLANMTLDYMRRHASP